MITIDNIISFVQKAMDMSYIISTYECNSSAYEIEIGKKDGLKIRFTFWCTTKEIEVSSTNNGYFIIKNISDMDIAKSKVLIEKCKEYNEDVGIDTFNNFFKEDNKPMDINDLDED